MIVDEPVLLEYSISPLLVLNTLKELCIMQKFVKDIDKLAALPSSLEKLEFILCKVLERELNVFLEEPCNLKRLSLSDCYLVDQLGNATERSDTGYYTEQFDWDGS